MTANPILRILKLSDAITAVGIIGVIFMLIVPLPSWLLDLLLALNIASAIVIVLTAINIQHALQFSVFPTLLLCFTLFKLALDLSSTRMVLLYGWMKSPTGEPIGAGTIIPAFGRVVVGGNIVVGFILFIILVVIQMMVITAGAERIAQVGARFTLDAMPMKQMAIDSELQSGQLTADEAKQRRRDVERESDFYGSMDGAGKFVKGDAMASVVIMVVNIVGGILVGMLYHEMTAADALRTFSILTIGNGLVTTIPGFLVSTAMGIIVSRAASESNFAGDLITQLTARPGVLRMSGAFMGAVAVLGLTGIGFPTIPFAALGTFFYFLGRALDKVQEQPAPVPDGPQPEPAPDKGREPPNVITMMKVEMVGLEVGRGLIGLVDPREGAKLLERVTSIRRHLATELGVVVPGVRFRDNLQLRPNGYVVKLKENELAQGEVQVNHFLAIGPEAKLSNLRGVKTVDPTYGMPAVWISPELRGDAERAGCMIFDPVSVVATHLTELLRGCAAELLGRQEVRALVDSVKKTHPEVVKELLPDGLSLGQVQKVLQNLVRERVSIRDLVTILETLADNVSMSRDPETLTEFCRVALCRSICKEYQNQEGTLNVLTMEPTLEQTIQAAISRSDQSTFFNIDPNVGQEILQAISRQVEELQEKGMQPILLTSPVVRSSVRKLVERSFPNLVLLSWNEIAPGVNVNSVAMVNRT